MGSRKTGKVKHALIALLGAFALLCSAPVYAQSGNIEVGMWVTLAPCKAGEKTFHHIDLYTKTLFKKDQVAAVDTASGEGLFESFFTPGEFDGKRLTCAHGGKRYKVASLREFEIKGTPQRVMLLYTGQFNELIWVQFDKALEAKEISW